MRTELLRLSDVVARGVGFRPRLVVDGPVDTLVVGPLRHQVLGVLGEAVSNAVRHAGARHPGAGPHRRPRADDRPYPHRHADAPPDADPRPPARPRGDGLRR